MIFDDLLQLTAKCQQLRQSESARNSALNQTVLKVVPYHFYFHIFHTYFFIIFFSPDFWEGTTNLWSSDSVSSIT